MLICIKNLHECEGRIEKSVPRIAIWHRMPCQLMTNGDPEGCAKSKLTKHLIFSICSCQRETITHFYKFDKFEIDL